MRSGDGALRAAAGQGALLTGGQKGIWGGKKQAEGHKPFRLFGYAI